VEFSRTKILEIVRSQLAVDYNCSPEDFIKDGITFCEASLNDGRRMFERQSPYLEIATMGRGIVVSGDVDILHKVRPILENKTRDDIFFAPFLYGHSLYYIPDCKLMKKLPYPEGFIIHVKKGSEIHELYEVPGFYNAIQYDKNHPRPDIIAIYAVKDGKIAAMAGASVDSKTMWQIGVDVLPAYRNAGLASCLVSDLTLMIMERGAVPYYGTASSNIASQSVAHRSGFMPAWMCTYRNTLDGKGPYKHL
jgi:Predicted acetyltransferase